MNWTLVGIVALVIILIVGPFATLRAVSHYRARRLNAKPRPPVDDEDDPDKPTGFW